MGRSQRPPHRNASRIRRQTTGGTRTRHPGVVSVVVVVFIPPVVAFPPSPLSPPTDSRSHASIDDVPLDDDMPGGAVDAEDMTVEAPRPR